MIMILALLLLIVSTTQLPLAQYYCGFSGDYCGQSSSDDTNAKSSLIVLAFANIASNGSVIVDSANFPCSEVSTWQQQGKKVVLSIGGANAQWDSLFTNDTTFQNGISSILGILNTTTVDGIDLDMEDYSISPLNITNFINQLKPQMRGKILTIAPQCPGAYQGQAIPANTSTSTGGWNFWVPILQNCSQLIDLVMVQAYNNWYDGLQGGTLSYLQDVYYHWSNIKSPFCQGCNPLTNFSGVNGSKLVIGILASPSAGGSAYFANNTVIKAFIDWTYNNSYAIAGMMMWDSHWDSVYGFNISTTVIQQTANQEPLTPNIPVKPMICTS